MKVISVADLSLTQTNRVAPLVVSFAGKRSSTRVTILRRRSELDTESQCAVLIARRTYATNTK